MGAVCCHSEDDGFGPTDSNSPGGLFSKQAASDFKINVTNIRGFRYDEDARKRYQIKGKIRDTAYGEIRKATFLAGDIPCEVLVIKKRDLDKSAKAASLALQQIDILKSLVRIV